MNVLLTGASGFVGSHILDVLQTRKIPTVVLARGTSSRAYFEPYLPNLEIRTGSITEPLSLGRNLEGVTHVIHCAGCTKASHFSDYRRINHEGTAHLVDAVNAHSGHIRRFIHMSSLAVAGPATADAPATEASTPHPVSEYGSSKLAAELEVRDRSQVPFTILRPPAVYGPRDTAFLPMFKAVRGHVLPTPSRNQALSLVFVTDLAEAVAKCLDHPNVEGKTYFVCSREVVTGRRMAEMIATTLGVWTLRMPVPTLLFWVMCLVQEAVSRLTGRASLLNLQKFAELRAPGWVCDPSRFENDLGWGCSTGLERGITGTVEWYQRERWL